MRNCVENVGRVEIRDPFVGFLPNIQPDSFRPRARPRNKNFIGTRDDDEDEDEVCTLLPCVELNENDIGFHVVSYERRLWPEKRPV